MLRAVGAIVLIVGSSKPSKNVLHPSPLDSPAVLRKEYVALQAARDVHARALHFYLLNDAADRYALEVNESSKRLENNTPTDPRALKGRTADAIEKANQYGGEITWCEFDADWTAASRGYEQYLHLWPSGPMAEEAWWRSRLGNKLNACYDGDGSSEETLDSVHSYAKFLEHFPQGKHRAEAMERLKQLKAAQNSDFAPKAYPTTTPVVRGVISSNL